MYASLLLGIFGALSVLALAFSLLAMRAADPQKLSRLTADFTEFRLKFSKELEQIRDVDLERIEGRAEALLERAELRFDSAERKRKSVAASEQHRDRAGDNGGEPAPWMDGSIPEEARRRALERYLRGR